MRATIKDRHTPGPWFAVLTDRSSDKAEIAIYSDKQMVVVCVSSHDWELDT